MSYSSISRLLIFSLLLLQGCASQSPQEIGEEALNTLVDDNSHLPSLQASKASWVEQNYLSADAEAWWLRFNDPNLSQLIDIALNNSPTVGSALARMEEAFANARVSRSNVLPSLDLEAEAGVNSNDLESAGLQSNPDRQNVVSATFTLSWQADLFGRLKKISRADKARLQAETERVRDTQRLLVSGLVQNYYLLISLRDRIKLSKLSVQRRTENVERIDKLLAQGYSTSLDKSRTDSQLFESKAALAQLELDEITLLNRLAVLVGVNMLKLRSYLKNTGDLEVPSGDMPLPSISLLIAHRSDLRAAERDLVAAAHSVDAAKAALYPTLGVGLTLGKIPDPNGSLVGSFPALDFISGGILANLAMPILGRGRLLGAIDANSARLKQAHEAFKLAVLTAVTEIDTAIVAIEKNHTIYQQRLLASDSAKQAAELSKELFKAGELDYTSVIVAEQTRVSAENRAISAKQVLLNAYILYLSAVAPVW